MASTSLPVTASAPWAASESDLAVIARFNLTEAAFPDQATLAELIDAQMTHSAAQTAVVCDHDKAFGVPSLTHGQLNERVNQLAHRLRAEGVGPGQIVAIMVERSFAMIIGVLGIIKAGGAYLPVSPANPPDRTDFMLKDAAANILLVHNPTASKTRFGGLILNLDDLTIYRGSTDNPACINKPQDLAYVIYTSGSAGKPKGVMIEHRSLINRLHWMQQRYPIHPGDVILQKTPYYFDVSVWELFWWCLQGARLCFLAPGGEWNPLAIIKTVQKYQVSVMHFVPSMLNVFLEYLNGKSTDSVQGLASLRRVFASGESLTPSHVRNFNAIVGSKTGTRLTNLYGPTEATVDVSYFDCPSGNDFAAIPIGRPIQNTRFYVLREGKEVAIGEPGELCIAGVGLARGYLNSPALTEDKFIDNPVKTGERIYRTGDVARWLPDGNVEYLGREDHQVKLRGLRIELGEIESTIREFPGIADCIVVVKKYSDSVTPIIAYVVCRGELEGKALKQHLARHLPDYMVPSHFEKIDRIPLTANGKADRNALPEPVIGSDARGAHGTR